MNTVVKQQNCQPNSGRLWFDDMFTREMDRFFAPFRVSASTTQAMSNVWSDENNLFLSFALPGVKKENVEIHFENGVLTVSGKEQTQTNAEERNYIRKEFSHVSFSRSFRLDEKKFDFEKVSAVMEDGVLTITLPLKSEEKKGNKLSIEIK